ncbi:molybdopterin-guanine dinucleotide biosynthesis protein A [Dongia deserti]|uniref:molybdopterin-guanine dinucleotide biosynthesis protein A n=1 Tax=Dongia deserti TaxID=2268030 RepID=UPI0025492122|nr:molybdopterin-guanine dinucleotide biosynthesis protein A [Dongia deserti]
MNMGLSLRSLVLVGAVLAGFLFVALSAQAQDSKSGTATAQPAAMMPENQVEADEGDHHEGYYYPKPGSFEHYPARVYTLPDSDRVRRQAFVIGLTKQLVGGHYAPSYAIFAKGNGSGKLIIVALADGQLNTIYRARALLATFTSVARSTPFFQQNTQPDESTFLDLLKLLGFKQVTVSDGRAFAHQIIID